MHGELIKQVLKNLLLLNEIAVVHVNGHQKGNSFRARGNRLADEAAKEAALSHEIVNMYNLTPQVPVPKATPVFTKKREGKVDGAGSY